MLSWLPLFETRYCYEQYWSILSHCVLERAFRFSLVRSSFRGRWGLSSPWNLTMWQWPTLLPSEWWRANIIPEMDALCLSTLILFPSESQQCLLVAAAVSLFVWATTMQRECKTQASWPRLLMCLNPCCTILYSLGSSKAEESRSSKLQKADSSCSGSTTLNGGTGKEKPA